MNGFAIEELTIEVIAYGIYDNYQPHNQMFMTSTVLISVNVVTYSLSSVNL